MQRYNKKIANAIFVLTLFFGSAVFSAKQKLARSKSVPFSLHSQVQKSQAFPPKTIAEQQRARETKLKKIDQDIEQLKNKTPEKENLREHETTLTSLERQKKIMELENALEKKFKIIQKSEQFKKQIERAGASEKKQKRITQRMVSFEQKYKKDPLNKELKKLRDQEEVHKHKALEIKKMELLNE